MPGTGDAYENDDYGEYLADRHTALVTFDYFVPATWWDMWKRDVANPLLDNAYMVYLNNAPAWAPATHPWALSVRTERKTVPKKVYV